MRQLAKFESEKRARTIGDALYAEGIDCRVEGSREGVFVVWVHDESLVPRAREFLVAFDQNPQDPRFARSGKAAAQRRKRESRPPQGDRHKTIRVRDRWKATAAVGPLTTALIVASVAVAFASSLGDREDVILHLTIARRSGLAMLLVGRFHDIASGEVWRLITPIFVHFGIIHLVFNMWWLKDLGTAIERVQSTWVLLLLVLVIGVGGNLGEYLMTDFHYFGGMSGVVYGLFSYIWIRGRFDPASPYSMPQTTVAIMVIWYVACLSGAVGNIANTAHTVGLVGGAAWGYLTSGHLRRKLR